MEENLLVVRVLGRDRVGLVAEITKRLADFHINIIDIEQSVIHGLFSMFMLIDTSTSKISYTEVEKLLDNCGEELGIEIKTTPFTEYKKSVSEDGNKELNVITIFGVDKPGIVAGVSKTLRKLGCNIERIKMIARGELIAMEMLIDSKSSNLSELREKLRDVGDKLDIDIIVQPESIFRWRKRLIVFDMDGTIVDGEIIDELAKAAGVGEEVMKLTNKGMKGKIDFEESLRKRVNLLKGLPVDVLDEIKNNMRLTPGSEELINSLKSMGYKLALISGGFTYFTDALKERLGFDYTYANELVIKDGVVTGELSGRIIDPRRKAEILNELARKEGISKDEIVAIGDGANDQIMLKNAGLGIAFNAKEILKKEADGSITKKNIRGLLYCLGVTERDLKRNKNCSA